MASAMGIIEFWAWPTWDLRFERIVHIERPVQLRCTPGKQWRQLPREASPVGRLPLILSVNGLERFSHFQDLELSTSEAKGCVDRVGWMGRTSACSMCCDR